MQPEEAGLSTADVRRKHGISSATFYTWKAKFGGLEVSDAKRLKQLEDENAKLKRLPADAMLDAAALKACACWRTLPVGAALQPRGPGPG